MSKQNITRASLQKILHLLPLICITVVSVPSIGMGIREGRKMLGLTTISVPVAGTGSMYPSLYWSTEEGGPEDATKKVIEEYRSTPHLYYRFPGVSIFGHTYLRRQIERGDIVAFKNAATASILKEDGKDVEAGFIKRIIGIPGDTLELRDGFVYRDGELMSEPYIATARSTYGGTALSDCTKLVVPSEMYFVMGDNRKISADSRFELGLVQDSAIEYLLPLGEQKIYEGLWRNTEDDAKSLGQPTLKTDEFIALINQLRAGKKLPPLTQKAALIKSAGERGKHLLDDKDTSYSMKQAIDNVGYTNIILGEFVSHGHFTARELLENILYSAESSKQILNKDFADIGLAAVEETVNGCPAEIIVGQLGGYIPASYDKSTIESWRGLQDNLQKTIPSWEKAVEYPTIDQAKLATLLTILRRRLSLAQEIVSIMEKKMWLNDAQQARIKQDEQDVKEAEALASELNK